MPNSSSSKKGNIHDAFFKHAFGHPKHVADFLRNHLHPSTLEQVDLGTLRQMPDSFPGSQRIGSRHADLVYAVEGKEGKPIYMLFLLEHQSKHDRFMGIRVLEYQVAIARAWMEKQEGKIPTILSFVFFHGDSQWTSATSIADLYDDFEQWVQLGLRQTFLVHLARTPIEELMKDKSAAPFEILLKNSPKKDMTKALREVIGELKGTEECCRQAVFGYMFSVDGHKDDTLIRELAKFDPKEAETFKDMFESVAKYNRTEGRQEGRLEGMQLGIDRGRQEGMRLAVQRLFAKGHNHLFIAEALDITEAEVNQLLAQPMEVFPTKK